MTLKRITAIALLTALLVLTSGSSAETYVFPVEPAALTDADLSREDAISIAKKEMETQQDAPLGDFENYKIKANCVKLESGEKAWVVMLDELAYETDALVTIASADATIIDYQTSDSEIIMFLLKQWTAKKGAMRTWSLEDKALFNWLFGNDDQYILPSENHIAKETAGNIALSAIPQVLAAPECSYAFELESFTDGRPDQYVWMVTVLEGGKEKYVVRISAEDGSVIELFAVSSNG